MSRPTPPPRLDGIRASMPAANKAAELELSPALRDPSLPTVRVYGERGGESASFERHGVVAPRDAPNRAPGEDA